MSKKTPARLEAALLLHGRYKKSFDKLPRAVQQLVRPAFSFGENGQFLWDLYTPTARLDQWQRWVFEHDPAKAQDRQDMWELQDELTRQHIEPLKDEIAQLKELSQWARQFDYHTRQSKLADDKRDLAKFEAEERELLEAKPAELHLVIERLIRLRQQRDAQADPEPPEPESRPSMTSASEVQIHRAIGDIYDHATARRMKPPNLREIGGFGQTLLRGRGLTASKAHIQKLAEGPCYRGRRRETGTRVSGTLLPFLLEER